MLINRSELLVTTATDDDIVAITIVMIIVITTGSTATAPNVGGAIDGGGHHGCQYLSAPQTAVQTPPSAPPPPTSSPGRPRTLPPRPADRSPSSPGACPPPRSWPLEASVPDSLRDPFPWDPVRRGSQVLASCVSRLIKQQPAYHIRVHPEGSPPRKPRVFNTLLHASSRERISSTLPRGGSFLLPSLALYARLPPRC
jgi:hypothetical protein